MSPKEKAEILVRKYYNFGLNNPAQSFSWYECQQCALIAADEVLGYMGADRGTEFWLEVRSEIEKL